MPKGIYDRIASAADVSEKTEKKRERMRIWRLKNRDRILTMGREYQKKRRIEKPEECRAADRRNKERNKDTIRAYLDRNAESIKAKAREKARIWRINNPEQALTRDKEKRIKYREKRLISLREYKKKNADKLRVQTKEYREKHPERYKAMYRKSAGLPLPTRPEPKICECCGGTNGKNSLCLDHCHTTGKFRGWLCRKCNLGIGALKDSLAGIKLAVTYLEANE